MEYRRRLHDARSDLAADTANIRAARAGMERGSSAIVRLPNSAVIWNVNVEPGMEVVKGERIFSYIDRRNLMVEVACGSQYPRRQSDDCIQSVGSIEPCFVPGMRS